MVTDAEVIKDAKSLAKIILIPALMALVFIGISIQRYRITVVTTARVAPLILRHDNWTGAEDVILIKDGYVYGDGIPIHEIIDMKLSGWFNKYRLFTQ